MAKKRKHYSSKEKSGSYYGKGHGSFANLPSDVDMKEYPKVYGDLQTDYPDTQPQIDRDLSDSFKKAAHYPSDSMY